MRPKGILQRIGGALAAAFAAVWKFAFPVFKLLKASKVLLTGGTMLLSVWFYSLRFGWAFAAGFVVCILVHEMGHVFAAWRLGMPVSAPVFIPGLGALIRMKERERSAWEGAIIGYGGPLFGTAAGLVCWAIYGATGNPLFLGLAFTTFLLNLFNMTPIYPLDGGRITAAVSPYVWIAGIVGMVAMTLTGFVSNPFIWIIVLLGLPQIWNGLKRGTIDRERQTTPKQRVGAGLAYVGLCAFLLWGMAATHRHPSTIAPGRMRHRAPGIAQGMGSSDPISRYA